MRVSIFSLCFLAPFAPLAFAQTPAAPATVSSTLDGAALQRGLDTAFAQARAAGFSGTLLVADRGERVYEAHAGLADREQNVAIDEHTRFNTASNGKLFTTVATLQLVAQKKLDLDASVGTYLPDWPQPAVRDQVTVRQLLSHTSGLGSYFGSPAFRTARASLVDVSAHLPLIQAETPAFAPGTDWAYSNSGFMLLGRLIEVVSGEDYYTYVQHHVFDPAGMRDSGYFDAAGEAEHVAFGYIPTASGLQDNRNTRERRGGPAGGGYTSARDLLRFPRGARGWKATAAGGAGAVLHARRAAGRRRTPRPRTGSDPAPHRRRHAVRPSGRIGRRVGGVLGAARAWTGGRGAGQRRADARGSATESGHAIAAAELCGDRGGRRADTRRRNAAALTTVHAQA